MITRAALLALLPAIALAIYIDGQDYDPEVFDFARASHSSLNKFFPPASGPLAVGGQIRLYFKDNLYEYVNGHAEFFISSGFKSLAVAGYRDINIKDGDPPVVAEIYDMGSPEGALEVISQEAEGLKTFDAGFLGYKSRESALFIKGSYYVKLSLFSGGQKALLALADQISKSMGEIKTEFPQFAVFPEPDMVKGSEGYTSQDYMGLDFMANVFTHEYERNGERFTAFVAAPLNKERFIGRMLSFYDETEAQVDSFLVDGAKAWEIEDKYEGVWSMARIGSEFIGVRGLEKSEERLAFLKEAVAKYRIK